MTNKKVTVHVYINAKTEKIEELIQHQKKLMEHFNQQKGIEYCEFLQDIDAKKSFIVTIKYSAQKYYEQHIKSEHLTKFITEHRPVLIDELKPIIYKTIIDNNVSQQDQSNP